MVLSPLLGRRSPQPKAPNIGKEHPLVLDLAAINYKKDNAAKSGPVDIFALDWLQQFHCWLANQGKDRFHFLRPSLNAAPIYYVWAQQRLGPGI